MTTTIDKKVGLGKTADGYRVVVHVKYGLDDMGNAERNPTPTSAHTHEPIPYPDVLSITGEVCDLSKRRSSPNFIVSAGQTVDLVREITEPAGSLTTEDTRRFAELWDKWHLNAMRAACAHMDLSVVPDDLPAYTSYEDRKAGLLDRSGWMLANVRCPVTGYKYGSAWLAENVPDEVVEEISNLIAKAQA
jgi:hypothetical protein